MRGGGGGRGAPIGGGRGEENRKVERYEEDMCVQVRNVSGDCGCEELVRVFFFWINGILNKKNSLFSNKIMCLL